MVILPHRRKAFRTAPASEGGGGDPYWDQVVLLLHADGTNGSTTFVDSSNSAKTVTAVGNAKITTTDPKFGTGSLLLDGGDDLLNVGSSSDWAFGTGDFTVETFVRFSTVPSTLNSLISNYSSSAASGWSLQWRNDGGTVGLYFYNFNTSLGNSASWTPAANTWYHVAVTRSSTTLRFWIDGVQSGSNITNSTNITGTNPLGIGALIFTPGSYLQDVFGRLDEIRITKGVARYTSNFTPPTQAFPNS